MTNKRKTQIVATIGPACGTPGAMKRMVSSGLDVARLNFSWGTYETHARYVKLVREAAKAAGRTIPVIQDLSGPRVQSAEGHAFKKGTLRALTKKDERDLEFGVSLGVEYVAMSYVGNAADINILRKRLVGRGPKVIAKIERREALRNLVSIVRAADAVMIARGDLGRAISFVEVPFVSEKIAAVCHKLKKPVITATQMLESMVNRPTPSRAEITDIAFAVRIGSSAVMLSEESAIGKYPAQAVRVMAMTLEEAERHTPNRGIRKL